MLDAAQMLGNEPDPGDETRGEKVFLSPFDIYVYSLTLACFVAIFTQQKLSIPLSISLSIVGLVISITFHIIMAWGDPTHIVEDALNTVISVSGL
jgi:hypothetical protein